MPAGRPSGFNPAFVKIAFQMALLGATDNDIATALQTSTVTINAWKQKYPEFLNSLNEGKAQADARVAVSLYNRATGYDHESVKIFADAKTGAVVQVPFIEHYPPDVTAQIFWLKNRQPDKWRDKIDLSGQVDGLAPLIQLVVIGANGQPGKNLLEGKIDVADVIGKGKSRRLPVVAERKAEKQAKALAKAGKKGAK